MHIDKKELEKAVSESRTYRETARRLGYPNRHCEIKKAIENFELDISHFRKRGSAYNEMLGHKYGMLTIISVEEKNNKGRVLANCICECGNKKQIRADLIGSGQYFSCGCFSKNRWSIVGNRNPAFKGCGKICANYFSELKRNASRRNLKFDLTIEQAWEIFENQNHSCVFTGVPIVFGRYRRHQETTASPDRIERHLGYTKENLQWVLKDINIMKGTLDDEQFIQLCNMVAKKHPR